MGTTELGRAQELIASIPTWRHRIDVEDGTVTPGLEDCQAEVRRLRLASSFAGQRVLDVGCSDGFYSFEAERRGATEVVAVDDESSLLAGHGNGFTVASDLIGSKVNYTVGDVHSLGETLEGPFDTIFFINVLYHVKNPMLAMEQLRSVAKPGATLYLKTLFSLDIRKWFRDRRYGFDLGRQPKFMFYPSTELGGDPTNWWAPNRPGVEALLQSTGWANFTCEGVWRDRIYYRATAT